MSTQPPNDFDATKLVNFVDSHTKEIEALDGRIKALEDRYSTNESLANTLCDTSETALKMQTMFSKTFVRMLKSDDESKQAVCDLIEKSDRNQTSIFYKRFGIWILVVISTLVGYLAQALINKYVGSP